MTCLVALSSLFVPTQPIETHTSPPPSPINTAIPHPAISPRATPAQPHSPAADTTTQTAPPQQPTQKTLADQFKHQRLIDQPTHIILQQEIEDYLHNAPDLPSALLLYTDLASRQQNIRLALEIAPQHPRVIAEALATDSLLENTFLNNRDELIQRLVQVAPQNALSHIYHAREALSKGDLDTAETALANAASPDTQLDNYRREQLLGYMDFYAAKNTTQPDAATLSLTQTRQIHNGEIYELLDSATMTAETLAQDGQLARASKFLLYASELTQKQPPLQTSQERIAILDQERLIQQLYAQYQLYDNAPYLATLRTPEAIEQEQAEAQLLSQLAWNEISLDSEHELALYYEHYKLLGEIAANQWLIKRHPEIIQQ